MLQMAINRRSFITGLAFSACAPSFAFGKSASAVPSYAGVRRAESGRFFVCLLARNGTVVKEFALPDRAHGMAHDELSGRLVVFARRPGTFGLIIDLKEQRQVGVISTPTHRHFFGHGVFSADGEELYATENDYENARGVIGIYDATRDFERIGELPTGGIGPHDVARLPDGQTLVIANGGIQTDPAYPRIPLNLPDMDPSLAYVDTRSGELLELLKPPAKWHQLSIRHLAVTHSGKVAIGCQFKGSKLQHPPLIAQHERGQPLHFAQLPAAVNRSLRHYIGSIVTDRTGRVIAASSPRGNKVVYLDSESAKYIGETLLPDACGLGAGKRTGGFALTGADRFAVASASGGKIPAMSFSQIETSDWDNHLVTL